jgi:hypothetical protein
MVSVSPEKLISVRRSGSKRQPHFASQIFQTEKKAPQHTKRLPSSLPPLLLFPPLLTNKIPALPGPYFSPASLLHILRLSVRPTKRTIHVTEHSPANPEPDPLNPNTTLQLGKQPFFPTTAALYNVPPKVAKLSDPRFYVLNKHLVDGCQVCSSRQ